MDESGNAARGIAASLGFAAIGIVDAHEEAGGGIARRLQPDQLIAADAGAPIRQRADLVGAESDPTATAIEHDKIIAEPMHFEKRDLAHAPAYMAAGPTLSNGERPDAWRVRRCACGYIVPSRAAALACRAPVLPCFAPIVLVAPAGLVDAPE